MENNNLEGEKKIEGNPVEDNNENVSEILEVQDAPETILEKLEPLLDEIEQMSDEIEEKGDNFIFVIAS